ncbi:hypothetical protein SAMN05421835_101787 [Amycolatopsis sacchari]|uniref:Uncharacterized protein n=1 Tax=Amycolatopsis sacchari TaxID=115433 RepID=A0A1I3L243_9PSEU|nr:hypothetical protein SAMN05421835_101787 [Amycolatopsis sacchari]
MFSSGGGRGVNRAPGDPSDPAMRSTRMDGFVLTHAVERVDLPATLAAHL